jgi:hypothetical protein
MLKSDSAMVAFFRLGPLWPWWTQYGAYQGNRARSLTASAPNAAVGLPDAAASAPRSCTA